jgi:hypothetical protein
MNRRERRRATKLGDNDIVELKLGRVTFKPGRDTSRDVCYLCGKPATEWHHPAAGMAHGFADINGHKVLLCEECFKTEENSDTIIKKYLNTPDLKIAEGGSYESVPQLRRDIAAASKARRDKRTH